MWYQNPTALDIPNLKQVSRRTGANITTILSAGVAGAVRKIMRERGGNLGKDATSLYTLPSPISSHSGTMMNNLYVGILVADNQLQCVTYLMYDF